MNITDYSFGTICIDGRSYTADVIIYPQRVQGTWRRKEGHRLDVADLEDVMETEPHVLIVGTGYYGRMKVPESTKKHLKAKGIELHIAPTREAVALFNTMRTSADIVAALHLTC